VAKGLPSTFYQTALKRRDFAARSKTKYGSLGAAGPAISLITGQVIPKTPVKRSVTPDSYQPIDHDRQKEESRRRFDELEKMYFRGENP
jgi:hypothetical protein